MKKILVIISVLAFTSYSHGECVSVSKEVESLIQKHAESVRGDEYCQFREVLNTQTAELILYTIEGPCYKDKWLPAGSCGNNFFRSMVGIVNGQAYKYIVVGGKGAFLTKSLELEEETIILRGLSYSSSDPMCCPKIESEKVYKMEDGFFIEENL